MASTSQMIDWVLMNANGWDRDGTRGVLPILNQVHKILLQNETEQTLSLDIGTGDFPSIGTVAGVFVYTMPSDIWRVSEVLVAYPLAPDYTFSTLFSDYGFTKHLRYLEQKVYYNKRYARLTNISTIDKTESSNCIVKFTDDPGDQISEVSGGTNDTLVSGSLVSATATFITDGVTVGMPVVNSTDSTTTVVTAVTSETQLTLDEDIFTSTGKTYSVGTSTILYRGYLLPNELTSESINLSGTEKFHMEILLPATVTAIQAFENGGWPELMRIITEEYKPKMIEEQNLGDQGLTYYTDRREA